MELSPTGLALLGLLMAAWTIAAAWAVLAAREQVRRANAARRTTRRLSQMIEASPTVPMVVRADGRIEAPERLAAWLGLDAVPSFLSELQSDSGGLVEADLAELQEAVKRTQKTAAPFTMVVTPRGSSKSLALRGQHADPAVSASGAALVWFFSEDEGQLARLRAEVSQARSQLAILSGLIDAAPIAMWFRGPDSRIRLVNNAYAEAVGAESADRAVADQTELADGGRFRIGEVPLDGEGRAGYAIDIAETEQQIRASSALQQAQRSMLERLSAGVAQFGGDRVLTFANDTFRRSFGLPAAGQASAPDFDRFLQIARDGGHLPETPDFERWRRKLGEWFAAENAKEDVWRQPDGTQLKVLGQPMPDGGLLLVVEEQIHSSSGARDILLRSRTAILDSLFESLAVFAQNGKILLWNRQFPQIWGLPDDAVEDRPRIEVLLDRIGSQLAHSEQRSLIGEIVRAATLGREQRDGRVALVNGRLLELSGVPLPDGSGLLRVLDVSGGDGSEVSVPGITEPLHETEVELMPFLTDIVREREAAIEAKQLTLDLRGDRRAGTIRADRELLGSAIGALLDHSIAATPEKGRILVALSRRKSAARIVISDDGPAREADETARQSIEAHGGMLEATDEKGGASVIITLP